MGAISPPRFARASLICATALLLERLRGIPNRVLTTTGDGAVPKIFSMWDLR